VRVQAGSVRGKSWGKFFQEVKTKNPGERVGVFCCGPMGDDLRANCIEHGEVCLLPFAQPAASRAGRISAMDLGYL
jgi:hypothetical protein